MTTGEGTMISGMVLRGAGMEIGTSFRKHRCAYRRAELCLCWTFASFFTSQFVFQAIVFGPEKKTDIQNILSSIITSGKITVYRSSYQNFRS